MKESAILAQKFVPANVKYVNTAEPNRQIDAVALPTLDKHIRNLRQQLYPLQSCLCTSTKHDLSVPDVQVEPETQFALFPRKIVKKQQKSTAKSVKEFSADHISNVKDYLMLFRALIYDERQEILLLYERYSLYQLSLNTSVKTRGKIVAQGLADAKPPIFAGDMVLLRPMRNMSLKIPVARRIKGADHYKMEWTAPVFALQFKAHVVQMKRAKDHTLVTTWLPEDLKKDINESYPEQLYNVRIIPSTRDHERCLTALAWVETLPPTVSNQLLLPNEAPAVEGETEDIDESLEYFAELNGKQLMFVRLVRARTVHPSKDLIRPPMILTGPAGTGKTRTMLAGIFDVLQLSSNHRILVCTPSHTAADVVTRRLSRMLSKEELWRLVDSHRPVATVPSEVLPYCRQEEDTGTFSLPSIVDELYKFRVIVCTCSDAHILYKLGFTNQQLRKRRECFVNFCSNASQRLNLTGGYAGQEVNSPHFTHLFVDEAAQATEPEVLIPLSVVVDPEHGSTKAEIGLVGDPRQLAPNIYSKVAADGGLGKSYMERILQRPFNYLSGGWPYMLGDDDDGGDVPFDMQHQRSCVFLTANYRGHVSSLMMPSCLFYYDKLTAAAAASATNGWALRLRCVEALAKPVTELALQWDECNPSQVRTSAWDAMDPSVMKFRRQETWPIHFRAVKGQDNAVHIETFAGSNSWSNLPEADAVMEIVITLISDGVSSASIGVMSPFRGQVVLIRKLLREKGLAGVDVGTIEDYQAVERDIIILSLTRSKKSFLSHDIKSRAGVFSQAKRTNVAMTRAEHLFIVVGDPTPMIEDPIWKQWLWFCLRNGLWYGLPIAAEILKSLQSKPITIAPFRKGENHALLGTSEEMDNVVVMSSMERTERGHTTC